MEEGLGELGFWLMVGMVAAAMIVSGAIKERDRTREKQATLRALLEKEGAAATEVLAYLRERDAAEAAEAARERAVWDESSGRWKTKGKALAIGIFALALGIYAGAALRYGIMRDSDSILVPLIAMSAIWVAGLFIAVPIWRSAKQK